MKQNLLNLAGLGLAISTLTLTAVAQEVEPGFKSLFNGKDLSGWRGNAKLWSAQDGTIVGETKASPKLTHNTFLVYTNSDFSDFELRLSYRMPKGNSGIQYRSKVADKEGDFGPIVGGYQADFEGGKTYSGILYEERGRGILALRGQKAILRPDPERSDRVKAEIVEMIGDSDQIQSKIKNDDWNDYVIIAKGEHLQHFINGVQTIDVTDKHVGKSAATGVLALQIHVGDPMKVEFKNVRIKVLKK